MHECKPLRDGSGVAEDNDNDGRNSGLEQRGSGSGLALREPSPKVGPRTSSLLTSTACWLVPRATGGRVKTWCLHIHVEASISPSSVLPLG